MQYSIYNTWDELADWYYKIKASPRSITLSPGVGEPVMYAPLNETTTIVPRRTISEDACEREFERWKDVVIRKLQLDVGLEYGISRGEGEMWLTSCLIAYNKCKYVQMGSILKLGYRKAKWVCEGEQRE